MIRPASKIRERRVTYKKPRIFTGARKKAKITLLGKQTMIGLDSAAKLVFENHKKHWEIKRHHSSIPPAASKQLGKDLIRIYAETKLGFSKQQMISTIKGVHKVKRKTLRTRKTVPELKKILTVIERLSKLANKQAQKGGIAEEYARSILSSYSRDVDWKDKHGYKRHTETYHAPKTVLYRLVKFSAYEAANVLMDAENRIRMQIQSLEKKH